MSSTEFHTTTLCSRPKVAPDTNPVLEIEEISRECSYHFTARQSAIVAQRECLKVLQSDYSGSKFSSILKVQVEGWGVLADSHSALAYTCIVKYCTKTDRLKVLYLSHKTLTEALQRMFAQVWKNINKFPEQVAKTQIRKLRGRLNEFIQSIHAEATCPDGPVDAKDRSEDDDSNQESAPPKIMARSPSRSSVLLLNPSRETMYGFASEDRIEDERQTEFDILVADTAFGDAYDLI